MIFSKSRKLKTQNSNEIIRLLLSSDLWQFRRRGINLHNLDYFEERRGNCHTIQKF